MGLWEKVTLVHTVRNNPDSDPDTATESFGRNITKVLLWSALVVGYVVVVTVFVRFFRYLTARRLRARIRAGEFPRLSLNEDGDILAPTTVAAVVQPRGPKGLTIAQLNMVAPPYLVAKDGKMIGPGGNFVVPGKGLAKGERSSRLTTGSTTRSEDGSVAAHDDASAQVDIEKGLSSTFASVGGATSVTTSDTAHTETGEESEHAECPVCLEAMEDNQLKRTLRCNHTYHAACIESWSTKNAICPVCRASVIPDMGLHSHKRNVESRIETGVIRVDHMRVRDMRRLVRNNRVPSDDEGASIDEHVLRLSQHPQTASALHARASAERPGRNGRTSRMAYAAWRARALNEVPSRGGRRVS